MGDDLLLWNVLVADVPNDSLRRNFAMAGLPIVADSADFRFDLPGAGLRGDFRHDKSIRI